jgi:eukaryotic-like serine/threonine-protein kinase
MACRESEFLPHFLKGKLGSEVFSAIEAHLEVCDACFRYVAAAAASAPASQQWFPSSTSTHSRLTSLFDSTRVGGDAARDPRTAQAFRPSFLQSYEIVGLLGHGGMGVVYRACHKETGRPVALKVVKAPSPAAFEGLRHEIEFLRTARHPGVVEILEHGVLDGDPWYAMELLEGRTLADHNHRLWSPRAGDTPPVSAATRLYRTLILYARICEPLAFVHANGIVHCDLKPGNIILRTPDQPVLMDFGLVTQARGSIGREVLDVSGRVRGTLPYIAPEVLRGQIPDRRTDVYALGCMLFETMTGHPPFLASAPQVLLEMHVSAAIPRVSDVLRDASPELDRLIGRLLEKNPHRRFGHAADLGRALWALAEQVRPDDEPAPPSPVWGLAVPAQLFRSEIVGRERELALLAAEIDKHTDTAAILLIIGESGIGKTFLASEAAQRALLKGTVVVTGECLSVSPGPERHDRGGSSPLAPFRRLFEMIRDRCRERGPAEVQRLFGEHLGLLAMYSPALASMPEARKAPIPDDLPAAAARERVLAALADVIAAFAAGRRLLIAIDDLQWADDLTLAFLSRISDEFFGKAPVVFVATCRSEESVDAVSQIASKPHTRPIHLERLTRAQIAALVSGMLSMADPPLSLVDLVYRQAEGIPFFAAESLRTLVAEGALLREQGGWVIDASHVALTSGASPFPGHLEELLRQRLARLAPETIATLEVAALSGREFSTSLLAAVVSEPLDQLHRHLEVASSRQIVESESTGRYRFLHDKLREALCAQIPAARNIELHGALAHAIEAACTDAGSLEENFARLAHHYRQSGDVPRAIDYFEKAGERALRLAANAEADAYLAQALALDAAAGTHVSPLRRARWERQRSDALQGLGEYEGSVVALRSAARLLGKGLPRGKGALMLRFLAHAVRQLAHCLWPNAFLGRGVARTEMLQERARVFDRLHQASFYLGNDAELVVATTAALNASESATPTAELCIGYANAAVMSGVLPAPSLAERYFRLGAALPDQQMGPNARSWLLFMEGAYCTWRGHRARAIAALDQALEICVSLKFYRRVDELRCARAAVDIFAGSHEAATPFLDAAEADATRRGDRRILVTVLLQRLECLVLRREPAPAAEILPRAYKLADAYGRTGYIWLFGVEAPLAFCQGDRVRAGDLVDKAVAIVAEGRPIHNYCINAYVRLAETAIALLRTARSADERQRWMRTAERACRTIETAARVFPIARPGAALCRGWLEVVRDRVAEGLEHWLRALPVARELSLPYYEARLHDAIARAASPGARAAEKHGTRAQAMADELRVSAIDLASSLDVGRPLVNVEVVTKPVAYF